MVDYTADDYPFYYFQNHVGCTVYISVVYYKLSSYCITEIFYMYECNLMTVLYCVPFGVRPISLSKVQCVS